MSNGLLLGSLSELAEDAGRDDERSLYLVADATACVLAGRTLVPSEPYLGDGEAGRVALLALRMSSRDLDDVDWTSLHHPGSVVLPVLLALGRPDRADSIGRAITSGYRVAATIADLLGIEHRRRWHVTATAGALGAASAASIMLGATPRQHETALSLAAANVGGIGQAPLERLGAASFNRAAASSLGLLAARSAIAGAQPTREPLTGARGLLALTASSDADDTAIREGIPDAAPRIFPVTGFAQSAVLAAMNLRAQVAEPVLSLHVNVTAITELMCDGTAGGDWWNLRLAVARAWASGDAFAVDDPDAAPDIEVSMSSAPLASGAAEVVAITASGRASSGVLDAPALDPGSPALLRSKWSSVLGQDPDEVLGIARDLMAGASIEGLVR